MKRARAVFLSPDGARFQELEDRVHGLEVQVRRLVTVLELHTVVLTDTERPRCDGRDRSAELAHIARLMTAVEQGSSDE